MTVNSLTRVNKSKSHNLTVSRTIMRAKGAILIIISELIWQDIARLEQAVFYDLMMTEEQPAVVALRPQDIEAIVSGLAANPQILAAVSDRVTIPTPLGSSQGHTQQGEMSEPTTSGKFFKKNGG